MPGITAERESLRGLVEDSLATLTALTPYVGYARASELAQRALSTGESVYQLVLAEQLLSKEQLGDPAELTRPRSSSFGRANCGPSSMTAG